MAQYIFSCWNILQIHLYESIGYLAICTALFICMSKCNGSPKVFLNLHNKNSSITNFLNQTVSNSKFWFHVCERWFISKIHRFYAVFIWIILKVLVDKLQKVDKFLAQKHLETKFMFCWLISTNHFFELKTSFKDDLTLYLA